MTLYPAQRTGLRVGVALVSLLLSVGPNIQDARAQNASARSDAEQRVLQYAIDHEFTRQVDILEKLGVVPGEGYYDCVCKRAGYGSSTTNQFFHPDTIGEFDKRYSCNQPGDPCVVAGFGCMRHPLPSDQGVWESCAQTMFEKTGKNPIDDMLGAIAKQGAAKPIDYVELREQCRGDFWAQREGARASEKQDGLVYLNDSRVPLLPPPKSLAGELKEQADREAAEMAAKVRKQQAQLKAALEQGMTAEVAKPLGGVVSRAQVKEAASMTLALVNLDILDAKKNASTKTGELKQATSRWKDQPDRQYNAAKVRAHAGTSSDAQRRLAELEGQKADLESFINGVDQMGDARQLGELYTKFSSGDRRQQAQGFVETTALVKKYADKYKAGSAALLADLKIKAAGAGLDKKKFAKLEARLAKSDAWTGASDVLGETVKAGTWAIQTYDAMKEFERELARSQQMATSGRYSSNQQRLLDTFRAMSIAAKKGAGYLPPGMSEIVAFYGTVLETPAQFDKVMRELVDKPEDFANIKGSQAQSKAMYKFNADHGGANLQRDPYMFRKAGLSAYRVDNPKGNQPHFVLIPDKDSDPIYLDRRNFEKVREMAYLYPIANGRRMTDADVAEALGSMGTKGTVNIDDLRNKANKELKIAASRRRQARMYGQKTVTFEESAEWWKFQKLMAASLPKQCTLPLQTQKNLFGSWRDPVQRERVVAFLQTRGAKLKAADHALAATVPKE